MKIAIFSDVHGNWSALKAVLTSIQEQPDLEMVVFAGDLCVFGPRPEACVRLLRESQILCIAGNTDHWVIQPPPLTDNMSADLREKRIHIRSISAWTKDRLSRKSLQWLGSLRSSFQLRFSPSTNVGDDLLIYHANPQDVNQLIFPSESEQQKLYGKIRQSDEALMPLLAGIEANTIAFGHLHIPSARRIQGINLFNISSVSMPGDGDRRAKYAILTWSENIGWLVERQFLDFDIEPEIDAFRENRPPGWERYVDSLTMKGFVPQIV